jgi:hypothetical protein
VPVPTPASAAITVKADSSDMDRGLRTRGANRFVRFRLRRFVSAYAQVGRQPNTSAMLIRTRESSVHFRGIVAG